MPYSCSDRGFNCSICGGRIYQKIFKRKAWRLLFTPLPPPKLLSKLCQLPGKFGLCPDSLNPDDTILAKLGRGKESGGIGPGGLGDSDLRIINDRNMPLGSTSCGPNGVLANTKGRMNLFHNDKGTTKQLLNEYISFRNENLNKIFEMFVDKIKSSASTMQLDPNKPEKLREDLQEHYRNVKDMFVLVAANVAPSNVAPPKIGMRIGKEIMNTPMHPWGGEYLEEEKGRGADSNKVDLTACGIGCVSFCQTWLRNTPNAKVGDAQFSVMSPHFQTRFHVTDDDALKERCGVTQTQIDSYITIIHHFDEIMSKDYGARDGGQAFVNLDKLHSHFRTGGGKNQKTKKSKKNRSSKKKRRTNKK